MTFGWSRKRGFGRTAGESVTPSGALPRASKRRPARSYTPTGRSRCGCGASEHVEECCDPRAHSGRSPDRPIRLRQCRFWVIVNAMSSFAFAALRPGRFNETVDAGLALAFNGGLLLLLRLART